MDLIKPVAAFVVGFVVLAAIENTGPHVMSRFVQSRFAVTANDSRPLAFRDGDMKPAKRFVQGRYMSADAEYARGLTAARTTRLMDQQLRSTVCGSPACAQPPMR